MMRAVRVPAYAIRFGAKVREFVEGLAGVREVVVRDVVSGNLL